MDTAAMFVGYMVVFGLLSAAFIMAALIHWVMIVCVINHMKVINYFGDIAIAEDWRAKRLRKTRIFFYLLLRCWKMPFASSRVSGDIDGYHWEYRPGLWPELKVNGVKV